jgi:hypothetical protein
VYVDLLAQLQARLVAAHTNKKSRSRSVPRKIDFTVESVDSPKLRAVGRAVHRSHQKPLTLTRVSRATHRVQVLRQQASASRSADDDDDDDDDANNGGAAGGNRNVLGDLSDDDSDDDNGNNLNGDDDDDDDDDGVPVTVTPIVSTPIRGGPDRPDHGPTALAVTVDFLLFVAVVSVVILGGGNLLEFALGAAKK